MASLTKKTEAKRQKRHRAMGRQRKNKMSEHSTKSKSELFADLGEPGKPAPKVKKED